MSFAGSIVAVGALAGDDTIAAIATASGVGGVGIVRVSGPDAVRIVADVLAGQGMSEVWSAPFVGADRYAALGLDVEAEVARTVRLANPLSDEQPLMRTRLPTATMGAACTTNSASELAGSPSALAASFCT